MAPSTRTLAEEQPPEGEEEAIRALAAISETQMRAKSANPTLRDQHPKSHGYAMGTFTIEPDLPSHYRHGIFANPVSYSCWVRFSNGTAGRRGDDGHMVFDPDAVRDGDQIRVTADVRGVAIKLVNVEGPAVVEAGERAGEQDFILMNSKVFFVKNVADYLPFFKIVKAIKARTIILDSQPPQIPAELADDFNRVTYALALAKQIKQQPISSPLQIPYWSATPYKIGAGAMKYSLIPARSEPPFDLATAADLSNGLREAVATHLSREEAQFDFHVQLQTDPQAMPIEDATVEWPESLSPFRKVASLRLPVQEINTPERRAADEEQSFSPWHALVDHRPLGGVNRARRMYGELARARNDANQTT